MRVLTRVCLKLYLAGMARQAGDLFIEGTIDHLTFYKMEGRYYARKKSSLTGKKFWKNKAFERSRESCGRFAEGNKLASKLYRMIEPEKRDYQLFCFLKKRAIRLIKEGKPVIEAEEILMDYLRGFGFIESTVKENIHSSHCFAGQETVANNHDLVRAIIQKVKNKKIPERFKKIYACAAGPPKVIGI